MDSASPSSDSAPNAVSTGPANNLPPGDQLPPVQPPSASFIMQLFLVPGLIVAAVVGVWALFGKISSSEQDWRQLVAELRSTNDHRRWRGANALAQLLRSDAELRDKGQNLAGNEQIAQELSSLLEELLQESTKDAELITHQSFVTRTLGWLDSEEVVCPALLKAMRSESDLQVRLDALRSVAQIASRKITAKLPWKHPATVEQVLETSQDSNPLIRQVASFALGLLEGDGVDQRLMVLLGDEDALTRTNAALAMTRKGNVECFEVLVGVIAKARETVEPASMPGPSDGEKRNQAQAQQEVNGKSALNAFRALGELAPKLKADQRTQALAEIERLEKDTPYLPLKIEASLAIKALREP